jgi:peptide/nickel transport system substrate-binding protein
MSRVTRIAAAVVAAAMLNGATLASATAQSSSASPAKKVVFTYGTANDIDSFNPLVAVEAPAYTSFALQYNLLLDFSSEDLSPIPGVASEVPTQENGGISADGLTWTFKIRTGMKWSDGQPLTARDVAFTYNYILKNSFGCCISYLKFVDSVTAPDDQTVVIHTTKPAVGMLSIYDYILPEHIWKDISKDEAKTFENFDPATNTPVTSGPFHLVNWDKGQSWTFEANPDYWAGAPHVDEVVFKVYQNYDAVVAALRSGEVDFADTLPANLFNSLQNQPDITTHAAVAAQFVSIGINTGSNGPGGTIPGSDANKSLEDPVLRKALAMAVDKQTLVDKVALGYATPGSSVVPPTSAAFHLQPPDPIPFDIEGAKTLLENAGYTDTNGDGIREDPKTGDPLSFRLFTRSEREDTQTSADFIIDWWKQIGVEAKQTSLTDTKLTDVIYAGNYDMFIWGWVPDPDPDFILSVLSCGQRPPDGIWSDTFYCDPTYDADYLKQKTLLNVDDRIALVKQMEQQVYDDVPYIVLYYDNVLQAYRSDRWTGFVQQPKVNGDLLATYGPYSFLSIRPVAESGGADSGGGSSTAIIVGLVVAALVVIGGVVLLTRRRDNEDDRA